MAKDTQTIISENISTIKELREEINRLKDSLVIAKEGSEEWNENVDKLNAAQTRLDKINKAAKGTLDQQNKSAKDSINTLKSRIKELNIERNAMDMNSKEYKKATAELKELNDKLRESGTNAGDWRANVGNYAQSLSGAFGQLGSAASGLASPLGAVNAGMTKIAANPIGMVVVALTAALASLAKGIKSSEENTNRWNAVLAPLKGLMDVILKYTQQLASKFLDLAEGFRESGKAATVFHNIVQSIITAFNILKEGAEKVKGVLEKVFGPAVEKSKELAEKIGEKLQPALDKLKETKVGQYIKKQWEEAGESTDKFIEEVNKATDTVDKLERARAAFAANERARAKANAKDNGTIEALGAEIAKYREAMNESTDYAEKKEYLAKISEKLNEEEKVAQEIAKRQLASAQEALNIARLEAANTDNNAEANDRLAAAEVAVINAQSNLNKVTREYTEQQAKLAKQATAFNEAERREKVAQATKDLTNALKALDNEYANNLSQMESVEKPDANLYDVEAINTYYDTVTAKYQAEYDAYATMIDDKIAKLEEFIEVQKALGEDTTDLENQIDKLRTDKANSYKKLQKNLADADKNRTKDLKANYNQQLSAYGGLLDAMQGLFEENTVAYKGIALAKAIMDTFVGANNALANLPPPASYVAAAASIVTGLANVAAIFKTDPKGEDSVPSGTGNVLSISTASLVDRQPYSYTQNVTSAEEEEMLNQPIFVSVTDINNMQNKVKVTENESTF